jgi:DNA modification methylase
MRPPDFEDQGVRLWCANCREILPVNDVALVLSDPPYGIAYDPSESTQRGIQKFAMVQGDDEHFSPAHLLDYRDVILWGCNNYCDGIPPKLGQWYFWDKVTQNGQNVRIAEGEFAWHKLGTKPRAFRHLWSGAYRASEAGERNVHPTQKPVQLMRWCLDVADIPEGAIVLDPYMGSGTTGIACIRTGRKFIGIEKDHTHFATARDRIRRELAQGVLFPPEPPAPRADTAELFPP